MQNWNAERRIPIGSDILSDEKLGIDLHLI
jgi:hypothetical protein